MKSGYMLFFLSFLFLLGLTACTAPVSKTMLDYEQSLVRADSLVQAGVADSAQTARLLSELHREYNRVKELSDGKRVRLMPADKRKQFFWGAFTALMIGLNVWLSISNIKFSTDRKHRRYLIDLSENEQRLRNNELEKNELQECLQEMSLTDEEREEVHRSLMNLMEHGSHLCDENASLRARLKDYEKRPFPRELELLRKEGERAHVLDGQVQALTSALIDRDEVVGQLRSHPKFLTDEQEIPANTHGSCVRRVYHPPCRTFPETYACRSSALPAHPVALYQRAGCYVDGRVARFGISAEVPVEEEAVADGRGVVCQR